MEQFDPKTYITREEKYLANMAGNGEPYPDPITRYEHYLAAIADRIDNGGGSAEVKAGALINTVSGASVSFVPDETVNKLMQVIVELTPTQSGSGDPSPTNVRPFNNVAQVSVYVSGEDTSDYETITVNLGSGVKGGHVDITNGKLTPHKYYESYNGETLVGQWLSSMDVYSAGATPTIGAEVIDLGANDTTRNIISASVPVVEGETNHVWTDNGTVSVTYAADTKAYIDSLLS